jgi:hypothetical protein
MWYFYLDMCGILMNAFCFEETPKRNKLIHLSHVTAQTIEDHHAEGLCAQETFLTQLPWKLLQYGQWSHLLETTFHSTHISRMKRAFMKLLRVVSDQ